MPLGFVIVPPSVQRSRLPKVDRTRGADAVGVSKVFDPTGGRAVDPESGLDGVRGVGISDDGS
jgi:hypothetical protein